MKSIYETKFVRVTADNYNNQLMTEKAYNIIRCQLSSGDFACHKVKSVKIEDVRGALGSGQVVTHSMVLASELLDSTPVETSWKRGPFSNNEMFYNGVRISRSNLQSGRKFYYVHWIENAHYAAPHSRMSDKFRSLQSAKRFAQYLIVKQSQDATCVAAFPNNLKLSKGA